MEMTDEGLERLHGVVMEDFGHNDCDVCTDARRREAVTGGNTMSGIKLERDEFHSRTLKLSGNDKLTEITIEYPGDNNVHKAVALDGKVIPAIIRAVNSHDDLLATLKGISTWLVAPDLGADVLRATRRTVDVAIEKAQA